MKIDENEFFRESTLRICGSIEIEKSLWSCLKYLKEFIPADNVYFHYIKPEQKQGTVFAMADKKKGELLNINFDYPDPMWRYIGTGKNLPEEMILNKANQHPVGKQMLRIIGFTSRCSILMIRLSLGKEEVGVLGFGAKGWNRFTQTDLKLIQLLRAPFAIALSNSKRYVELLKLKNHLADDNKYLQNELRRQQSNKIVGADFGLSQVMQKVQQVSPLESPVLLLGETGVGKELVANAIHYSSKYRDGPFIKVNCGAIPETLIDSELFGHEKGAFTGAFEKRRGRFERANGGSIFLDEIGELPMVAQLRFLRVLQEMEFEPVGAKNSIRVDIRVIAATNRNLETLIQEGRFRQDLFFRLNVFPIFIPPLRERKCDIPELVQHFILKKYRKMGFDECPVLSKGAFRILDSYNWPGNVRELENAVEKAMILSSGNPLIFDELETKKMTNVYSSRPLLDVGQTLILDEIISLHIKKVLELSKGKISGPYGAAEFLEINPATLRNKMRKLGIPFGRGVPYK